MLAGRGKWKGLLKGAGGLKPQDVFATSLVNGIFEDTKITTGIDMLTHGGLVWAKERNNSTRGHFLVDTVRGGSKRLASESANGQNNSFYIDSFESNGFWVDGISNVLDPMLSAGNTHVAWSFRRAPKFFDVVTYTGDGTAGRTIAHGLGITPGLIIVKQVDASANWAVWHRSLAAGNNLQLNSTGSSISNGANPIWVSAATASTFTVNEVSGLAGQANGSGGTFVAYLFAHDTAAADGIVQCGGISGLGYGSTVNVTLGWQPQFLMAKPSTQTGPWVMLDTARGWATPGTDARISANTSAAESTADQFGHPLSTGFQLRGFDDPANGSDYVYLAIRAPIT